MKKFAKRTKFNSISLVGTKELKDLIKPNALVAAVKKFVSKVCRDHFLLFTRVCHLAACVGRAAILGR